MRLISIEFLKSQIFLGFFIYVACIIMHKNVIFFHLRRREN
ncbi:hypothetical protein HMPREF9096_01358 [Haemophilus sp. oral taxon 851 str. F0397]|nr:hypothetical protein HMPREF9096_01358 [Haemophilus sp. oral taxon 851 str. F0397]